MTAVELAQIWAEICTPAIAMGFVFAMANYLLDTIIQAAFGRRDRR